MNCKSQSDLKMWVTNVQSEDILGHIILKESSVLDNFAGRPRYFRLCWNYERKQQAFAV